MATNLSVESPDFDEIRTETGLITSNAIKLLWEVLNYELGARRKGVARATNFLQGKITMDISTAHENNLDTLDSMVWWFNTASNINVTGLRNGVPGRIIFFHNVGSGTISFLHGSGSSDSGNQFVNNGAATVAMGTNQSVIYIYINGKWREVSAA